MRTIPSLRDEQYILGRILLAGNGVLRRTFRYGITTQSFKNKRHQKIFFLASHLMRTGEGVGAYDVAEALRRCGWLQPVGGTEYLENLVSVARKETRSIRRIGKRFKRGVLNSRKCVLNSR